MALVDHVKRIFSEFRYNHEEFIQAVSFGMTTNHNEAIHTFLNDMAPKKDHVGFDALKLAAALAIIRYNEGFKPVHNITHSLSPSNPFIRTKEGFRLLDNKRIMNSKKPSPWTDTFAEEEMNQAERREQILKFGDG